MDALISNMGNTYFDISENKDSSCQDRESGLLETPLPFVNDVEGEYVPVSAASVIDAHVHLFPDHLFSAVWQWFEKFGWPIRYKLSSEKIIQFLLSRGISRIVALHYAHKPGVSRDLNAYMADLCRSYPQVTAGLLCPFP